MGKADELWRLRPTHKISHIHNLSVSSLMRVNQHESPGLGPHCPLNALDNYPLQSDGVEGWDNVPPPPCLDVSMQRETKKEMERGERGRWRGRGGGERNGLVLGVRLFFQPALQPARFTPLLRMDFSQWRIFDQSSFKFDFCHLKLKYPHGHILLAPVLPPS